MANWCLNEITIKGEKTHLDKLKKKINDYINHSKKGNKIYFMEYLIGLGNVPVDYNESPEEHKKKWFGTRCDMELTELKFSINDEKINIEAVSLWTPIIAFVLKLCEKYNVTTTMDYYEPQGEFGGRVIIDKSGTIKWDEWTYLDALFLYNNDTFWQELKYYPENYSNEYYEELIENQTTLSDDELNNLKIQLNIRKYNL